MVRKNNLEEKRLVVILCEVLESWYICMSTKLPTKRLTTIGGVTLDPTVAEANVSCLTFGQDQTLLDPNDKV